MVSSRRWYWTTLPESTRVWIGIALLPVLLPLAVAVAFLVLIAFPIAALFDFADEYL